MLHIFCKMTETTQYTGRITSSFNYEKVPVLLNVFKYIKSYSHWLPVVRIYKERVSYILMNIHKYAYL